MARVLVTDGEQRSTLAVVRSLGRAGHHVMVCAASARPLAGASRFSRSTHAVPEPGDDASAYRARIDALIESEGVDVLLPMTDVAASLLLVLRDSRPGLLIPFPPRSAYEEISDKRRLMEVGRSLGVAVPEQVVIETKAGAATGARDAEALGFPLVLKPARSAVVTEHGVLKFGVRIVPSRERLDRELGEYAPEAYPILAQAHVSGPGLGAFMLARDGRTVAAFAHRRLREKPPSGGVSVYRESVPMRADVREAAERILGHFGWTGVAMVEFKEDSATGVPYLMEVNARFWGSLQLAIDAGVDFPKLLVGMTLGDDVGEPPEYRLGVRSRWLWGDFDHLIAVARGRGPASTPPTAGERLLAAGRFLLPWRPGDRYEVLRLGDPLPFVRESVHWVGSLWG